MNRYLPQGDLHAVSGARACAAGLYLFTQYASIGAASQPAAIVRQIRAFAELIVQPLQQLMRHPNS